MSQLKLYRGKEESLNTNQAIRDGNLLFSTDTNRIGFDVGDERHWTGTQGPKGDKGDKGDTGSPFTYEMFSDEALAALTGPQGLSAYDVAVKNGYTGTEAQWLDSLRGAEGETIHGLSAGFAEPTATATTLEAGSDATVQISASGPDTAKEFSFTFGIPKGEKGDAFTYNDFTETQLSSLKGEQGIQGLSAYDIAVKNGYPGTENEWLQSLKGETASNPITSISVTGNGNAITGVSGTSELVFSKDSTFLTEHPSITKQDTTTEYANAADTQTLTVVKSIETDDNGHVTKITMQEITLHSYANKTTADGVYVLVP